MTVAEVVVAAVSVGGSFLISWFEARKRTSLAKTSMNTVLHVNETIRNVTYVEGLTIPSPAKSDDKAVDWQAVAVGSIVAAAMLVLILLGILSLYFVLRRTKRKKYDIHRCSTQQ